MARRRNNKIVLNYLFVPIALVLGYFLGGSGESDGLVPINRVNVDMKEKDYVNMHCKGIKEYILPDKTRVDCLTDEHAIEYDWASKWAESVGQSLYYAHMTGLKPAVAIIMKNPQDEKYIKRIQKADERIVVFRIKAYEQ